MKKKVDKKIKHNFKGLSDEVMKQKILVETNLLTGEVKEVTRKIHVDNRNITYVWMDELPKVTKKTKEKDNAKSNA